MPSQVVFLIDLDQALPIQESLSESVLTVSVSRLCRCLLHILCSRCSLGTAALPQPNVKTTSDDRAHAENDGGGGTTARSSGQDIVHFGVRFYSASGYFALPSDLNRDTTFKRLNDASWETVTSFIQEHFDRCITSTGKDHLTGKGACFSPDELRKQLLTKEGGATNLKKALQEIAALYEWDRPDLHSPVKALNVRKKSASAAATNEIFVVARLPHTQEEMGQFFHSHGKNRSEAALPQTSLATEKYFLQNLLDERSLGAGSQWKEADVALNFIDTNHCSGEMAAQKANVRIKGAFAKALKQLRGLILPYDSVLECCQNATWSAVQNWSLPLTRPFQTHVERLVALTKNKVVSKERKVRKEMKFQQLKELQKCLQAAGLTQAGSHLPPTLCKAPSVSTLESVVSRKRKNRSCEANSVEDFSEADSFSNKRPRLARRKSDNSQHSTEAFRRKCSGDERHFSRKSSGDNPAAFSRPSSFSRCSSVGDASHNTLSRGAELLRLGQSRRALRSSTESKRRSEEAQQPALAREGRVQHDKSEFLNKYEQDVKRTLHTGDLEQIVSKLMELQHTALTQRYSDGFLLGLAELTVGTILRHLSSTGMSDKIGTVIEKNFLVTSEMVSRRKTSVEKEGRVVDHKLQILYRIELHWLVGSKELQQKLESSVIGSLRQISIWFSSDEVLKFLSEVVTPNYSNIQAEMLCSIYEELNLPKPDLLPFSPEKKLYEGSSPMSAVSHHSSVSHANRNDNSAHVSEFTNEFNLTSEKQKSKIEKLTRRLNGFDLHRGRQIDLSAKGAAAHSVSTLQPAKGNAIQGNQRRRRIAERSQTTVATVSSRQLFGNRATLQPASKRVKRNLAFDDIEVKDKTVKKKAPILAGRKSPKKTPSKTPKRKREPSTPSRYTPRKTHQVLAPETPSQKSCQLNNRLSDAGLLQPGLKSRKSDGVLCIKESPDVGAGKTEGGQGKAQTTPRRVRAASLAIRRRASFYSGNVSRNLLKAEANLQVSRLQQTNFQRSSSALKLSDSADASLDKTEIVKQKSKRNSMELLFPHLLSSENCLQSPERKRCSLLPTTPVKDVAVTPTKSACRKVAFNMTPQPKTPRSGKKDAGRGILKGSPTKELQAAITPLFASPEKRTTTTCNFSPQKCFNQFPEQSGFSSGQAKQNEDVCLEEPRLNSDEDEEARVGKQIELAMEATESVPRIPSPDLPASKEMPESLHEAAPPIQFTTSKHQKDESDTVPLRTRRQARSKKERKKLGEGVNQIEVKRSSPLRPKDKLERPSTPVKGRYVQQSPERKDKEAQSLTPGRQRPSRFKSTPTRFGIDDVSLGTLFSPSAKPASDSQQVQQPPETAENDEKSCVVIRFTHNVLATSGSPASSTKSSFSPVAHRIRRQSVAKRKLELRTAKTIIKTVADADTDIITDIETSSCRRRAAHEAMNVSEGSGSPETSESPQLPSDTSPNTSWAVSEVVESPRGEIRLKFNRTKKPQQKMPLIQLNQRLSRRSTQEFGISPDKLRKIMFMSPSPKKTSTSLSGAEKENEKLCKRHSQEQANSSKFSPLSSVGLYNLTKSPLVTNSGEKRLQDRFPPAKRRKVNKKLDYVAK